MKNFKLNFLGRGSAFNVKEGSNSAFTIVNDNILILFDCGSDTFQRILEEELLTDISEIHILITHMHQDHVGSLVNLLFYLKYVIKDIFCYVHSGVGNKNNLEDFASLQGFYFNKESNFKILCSNDKVYIGGYSFLFMQNKNHSKNMISYYIYIKNAVSRYINDSEYHIYTGDVNCFPPLLGKHDFDNCKRVYIDCSFYSSEVHYHINDLKACVERVNYPKNQITCMHFDCDEAINIAKEIGFEVPEIYRKELR